MLWKIIEVADFSILLICKFRQYKIVNIANFVYYGKTQMEVYIISIGDGSTLIHLFGVCFVSKMCTRTWDSVQRHSNKNIPKFQFKPKAHWTFVEVLLFYSKARLMYLQACHNLYIRLWYEPPKWSISSKYSSLFIWIFHPIQVDYAHKPSLYFRISWNQLNQNYTVPNRPPYLLSLVRISLHFAVHLFN